MVLKNPIWVVKILLSFNLKGQLWSTVWQSEPPEIRAVCSMKNKTQKVEGKRNFGKMVSVYTNLLNKKSCCSVSGITWNVGHN